eukprot:Ihof_evm8s82 gene=Ihof_evmTU8s82
MSATKFLEKWKSKKKNLLFDIDASASTELNLISKTPMLSTSSLVESAFSLQSTFHPKYKSSITDVQKIQSSVGGGKDCKDNTSLPSLRDAQESTTSEKRTKCIETLALEEYDDQLGQGLDGGNKRDTIEFIANIMVPYLRRSSFGDGVDEEGDDGESQHRESPNSWAFLENRGFIRLFHRDANRHTLLSADLNITTEMLCGIAAEKFKITNAEARAHKLYIQMFTISPVISSERRLYKDEQPLRLQHAWLMDMGYGEDDIQLQGRNDIYHLIRFVYTDKGEPKNRTLEHAFRIYEEEISSEQPSLAMLNLSNLCLGLRGRIHLLRNMVPSCISGMKVLVSLTMAYNDLTELDEGLWNCRSLRNLICNNNQLTSLADDVTSLKYLEVLDIRNNHIKNLPMLTDMRLKTFYCSGNHVTQFKMENMRDLEAVLLSNNCISIFSYNLAVITQLDLSCNNLSTLPNHLDCLQSLQVLRLDDNRLVELPDSFSALTSLEILSIKNNSLWALPKMQTIAHLRKLNVSINNLTHLPDDLFELPFLQEVNASSNKIQRLPLINDYNISPSGCQYTDSNNFNVSHESTDIPLVGNRTCTGGNDSLRSCTRIEEVLENMCLDNKSRKRSHGSITSELLSGSRIAWEKPSSVGKPEYIYRDNENENCRETMHSNEIQHPYEDIPAIKRTTGGRLIKKTSSIPGGNWKGRWSNFTPWSGGRYSDASLHVDVMVSPITELYLGKNKLRDDTLRNCISRMHNLQILHLGDNALTELNYVARLSQLETLVLSGNELSFISDDIGYLTALRELYLNDNKLRFLPQSLCNLNRLAVLDISNNNMSCKPFSDEWIWTYNKELQCLDLSRNKQIGILNLNTDFRPLPKLKYLNLEGVQLPCRCKDNSGHLGYAVGGPLFCTVCIRSTLPQSLLSVVYLGPYMHDIGLTEAKNSGSWLGLLPRNVYSSLRNASITSVGTPDDLYRAPSGSSNPGGSVSVPNLLQGLPPLRTNGEFINDFLTEKVWSGEANLMKGRCARAESDYDLNRFNIRHGHFNLYAQQKKNGLKYLPSLQVFCLFVGHNGKEVAKYVHEVFISTFWEELVKSYDGIDIDNTISRALRRTFLAIDRSLAKDMPHISRISGCSGVTVCISKTRLFVANCGTAMAVLCRSGKAVPLSCKHTTRDPAEHRRIITKGGYISDDGKIFGLVEPTRAFGLFFLQSYIHSGAFVSEHHLTQEDELVILGCSGLWEVMSFQTACDIARNENNSWRAAKCLRDYAYMFGGKEDGICVQVIYTPKQLHPSIKTVIAIPQPYLDLGIKPDEVTPPHGKVTLVFTDIKNSTELWEKETNSMREAMRLHNELMRLLLRKHRGYEVKTEGDAFMVSFETAAHALQWCLNVQLQLMSIKWPRPILDLPECEEVRSKRSKNLLFVGVRVRMGIHTGSPDCDPDPVTGRMDYFGPMVNRSARVSSLADGGQIVISHNVWQDLQGGLGDDTVYRVLGAFKLKGLAQKEIVYQ